MEGWAGGATVQGSSIDDAVVFVASDPGMSAYRASAQLSWNQHDGLGYRQALLWECKVNAAQGQSPNGLGWNVATTSMTKHASTLLLSDNKGGLQFLELQPGTVSTQMPVKVVGHFGAGSRGQCELPPQ